MAQPPPVHGLSHVRALLGVVSALRAGAVDGVLAAAAEAIAGPMSFGTVAVNLYRPAWDDFEVVLVRGPEEARELLLGTISTAAEWAPLLDPRYDRGGAFFVPHGDHDWRRDGIPTYVADAGEPLPGGWHPEDALLLPLRSATDELMGIISVDEPRDGRRPSEDELDVLVAIAAHAAVALEQAQVAAEGRREQHAVERLLAVSAQLTALERPADVLRGVCDGVRDALGFQRVLVSLVEDGPEGRLRPAAAAGWSGPELGTLQLPPVGALARLLESGPQREGCVLATQERARALLGPELGEIYASTANGRGRRAWQRHWLLVGLRDAGGRLRGMLWADDPDDRLLPSTAKLKALRAFANQAVSAIASAEQRDHLLHLAHHDPLTGLRNRRAFEDGIARRLGRLGSDGRLALLTLDLDHFASVNDALGHEAGDELLRRFAALVGDLTRDADAATRLGGAEFAVLLDGADAPSAGRVAERLRRRVRDELTGPGLDVTVSVGVADAGQGEDARDLVRRAGRALQAAKHLGRDRCVVHDPGTETLLAALRRDGAPGEQVAAAVLLAETLDLRDPATARHSHTVGALAEAVARELGWTDDRVERVRLAGVLHDVGKLGVPDAILFKPGPLDDEEWAEMRRHAEIGAQILEHAGLSDVAGWVLAHHERPDGDGYPQGLRGQEIPPEALILGAVDAFEAMTADRPYRRAPGVAAARAELRRHAGTQFDAAVVDALLRATGADGRPTVAGKAAGVAA